MSVSELVRVLGVGFASFFKLQLKKVNTQSFLPVNFFSLDISDKTTTYKC